jgi:hypothetical protein
MDSKFGAYGWRPSPRFGRRQNGKVRCIDDGKRSLLNKAYQNTETVALMEPRFTAAVGQRIHEMCHERGIQCPAVGASVDDEPNAFRNIPVAREGLSVTAVISPKSGKVFFFPIRGHMFGGSPAMPNYCEKSCVMSICAAVFTAAPVEPYVDDLTTVETELSRGAQVAEATGWEAWPYSAEAGLWTMASLMTSPLAEEKRIGWTSTPASCGVQTDLDELPSTGEVRLRIKESTREKVLQLVATILEEGHFGAGIQAHLTGKLGYVLLDKAGRAALQPLVDHVCDDGRIDLDQSMALSFIQKLLGGELPDMSI